MKKKNILGIITISTILCMSVSMVFASSAYSTKTLVSVNNLNYGYQAIVDNSSTWTQAATMVENSDWLNVPTGYLGALARLYNSSGVLCASSSWLYNSSSANAITNISSRVNTLGTYYSYGQVKLYNGNGYNKYNTKLSPVVSNGGSKIAISETQAIKSYESNEKGETYGSGLYAETIGVEPDLILAYGIDGTLGYVRSNDFGSEKVNSPDEAKALKVNSIEKIPLYDKDGETIIGSFKIENVKVSDKDNKK